MWAEGIWDEIVISVTLIALFGFLLRGFGRAGLPTGPIGLPFIGNALSFDFFSPHLTLTQWAKIYGNVFTIKLYGSCIVVLNSYDAIYEALVQRSDDFSGRPRFYRSEFLLDGKTNISLCSPTPKWRALHEATCSALRIPGHSEVLDAKARSVLAELTEVVAKKEGEPFDPKEDLYFAVCSMMCVYAFGKRRSITDPELRTIQKAIRRQQEGLSGQPHGQLDTFPWLRPLMFPWLRLFKQQVFKHLSSSKRYWKRFSDSYVKQAKYAVESEDLAEVNTICQDLFISQKSHVDKEGKAIFDEGHVKAALMDIFFSGTMTTSYALYSLLLILLNHPKVQKRVHDEIDSVVGRERMPELADRNSMPYTVAMLWETLRYASHAALVFPRATTNDTIVSKRPIPKGTQVFMNLWSVHHDETFWNEPWKFKPQRFLDSEGQLLPPDHANRQHCLPFGAGLRMCVGATMARNRLFLFSTALLQKFRFVPPEDAIPHDCDPRRYEPKHLLSPEPYQLRALPRS